MVAEIDARVSAGQETASKVVNAEDLRIVLRQAELAIANIKGSGPRRAVEFVRMLDTVEEAVPRLEAEYGVDLKPERTRLETLENTVNSRLGRLVAEAGPATLAAERERVQPPDDEWWWFLDQEAARRRQATLRHWAIRALVAAGILLVALVAYEMFLAPSPEQQAITEAVSEGESAVLSGDLEGALVQYERALALSPDDAELRLFTGALYEALGQQDKASEQFAEGERQIADPARYHASLALVYYRMASGGVDVVARAEEEALAAVEANDSLALAHFALASVYELQGRNQEAIMEFELTSSLSSEPQLTVLARMRMGMLMQSPGAPAETVTGEAEPTGGGEGATE